MRLCTGISHLAFMNTTLVRYTALVELFELLALYLVKRAAAGAGDLYRVGAAGVYAGTALVLVRAVERGGLGVANGLWNAFSNLAGGAIGIWQGERYSATQWLGLALGVASSLLLAWH